jgi:hypothetical protein
MVSAGRESAIANQVYSSYRCPLNCALTGDPVRMRPGYTLVTTMLSRAARCEGVTEAAERELAGGVGHHVRYRDPAADRRDVHNAPPALAAHGGDHGERQMERTPEMRVHRLVVVGQRHVIRPTQLDGPGIVDHDVDGPNRSIVSATVRSTS